MLKEEKLKIIEEMLCCHDTLSPLIFDENQKVKPFVCERFLQIADYALGWFDQIFTQMQVTDIVLAGSMCSYVNNDQSDVDLFIMVKDIVPGNKFLTVELLTNLDSYISSLSTRPMFYTHPVDCGVLIDGDERLDGPNHYSLLHNEWIHHPSKQKFAFTPQELFDAYAKFSADFHRFVEGLPKVDGTLLTAESCHILENYLHKIRIDAFEAKNNSPTLEYSLDYNIYRLFKKFGGYGHFRSYVSDSYKHVIGAKK